MRRSKQDTFDEIYALLEDRLNEIGPVRADDAWKICRGKTYRSYPTIVQVFGICIRTMIEQGKAKKLDKPKGRYVILIPNDRKTKPAINQS